MISSLWRYIHLVLAIIASLFFALAALTGIIIAVNNIDRHYPSYKIENFDQITLAQSIEGLKQHYPEITSLSFDHRGFATIKAVDSDGNEINAHINPLNGKVLGQVKNKPPFVKKIISLHRSLEMEKTGRIIMGIIALFLVMSALSGLILILKKQNGIRNFFKKSIKDNFSSYYHTIFGKWLLIPLLIIGITGVYLVYNRFFIEKEKIAHTIDYTEEEEKYDGEEPMPVKEIVILNQITLNEVLNVEFPFDTFVEDTYLVKLKDRELVVSQFSGKVLSEVKYPLTQRLARVCQDLHTGRASVWWAVVLVISCIGLLFFIYTGFRITFARKSVKIVNKYSSQEAQYVILYGSEGGNTLFFAEKILSQLLSSGKKAYLESLNQYKKYPQATHFLIFTSTYGVGNPPSNADRFISLLGMYSQDNISYSVVGFGSRVYPDFCQFANEVHQAFSKQPWAKEYLPLYTINEQSLEEFLIWVKAWNAQSEILLSEENSTYQRERAPLYSMRVLHPVKETAIGEIFTLQLQTNKKYTSGDLLAIYPDDKQERLYSIGKVGGKLQLTVKLHEQGIGSNYLYNLQKGQKIKARIISNPSFHMPKESKKVIFVSCGTGIAPFLGMIDQNKHTELYLYVGFRYNNEIIKEYKSFFDEQIEKGKLRSYHFIFSREQENKGYVTDLLKKDIAFVKDTLDAGGVIMICGMLSMYKDVAQWIDASMPFSSEYYKANRQFLADCY